MPQLFSHLWRLSDLSPNILRFIYFSEAWGMCDDAILNSTFSSKWNLVSNLTNLFGERTLQWANKKITGVMRGKSLAGCWDHTPDHLWGIGYLFTQSHAIFACLVLILLHILSRGLPLLDYALWKITADTFVHPLCTSENVRHISGALFPTNALVTWQPQEPIKLPSCDLATRAANHSVLLWPCSHGMAQQLVQPWSLASNHLSRRLFLLVCGGHRIDCNCRGCLSS